jgi:hypothetical protein
MGMKTFKYYVTYHYEDSGEVEAGDYNSALAQIENHMSYVVSSEGYSLSWDWVDVHELDEIDDDGKG